MKKIIRHFILLVALIILVGYVTEVSAKTNSYMNLKSVSLQQGKTVSLKVVNNKKSVKWSSSNKKIATVKKGKVTAKKAGNATIKAKVGKKTYSCKVTVTDGKKKVLVVYFSHTGTTEDVAKKVAKAADADLLEIYEKNSYTQNYDKLTDIAKKEQKKNARPAIATQVKNFKQYDTVYVGYPIWWGKEPMVIRTFLQKYNWSGKTVIPFCTSGGSGISGSISGIKKYAKKATVLSGKDLTDMIFF